MSRNAFVRGWLLVFGVGLPCLFLLPAGQAEEGKGKKSAVLIGVRKYRHSALDPLRGTENDIEELAKVLQEPACGYSSVRILFTRATVPRGKDLKKEYTNAIGMKLVHLPRGKFTMGSPKGEADRDDKDEEQHEVEVAAFHLGIHEVTQKEFRAVMGYNPSYFSKDAKGKDGVKYTWEPGGGKTGIPKGDDTETYPVENVSWEEAEEFCKLLMRKDTKKPSGLVYRLPREAEWEYACRGGATSYQVFHYGNSLSSKQANFDGNFPYGGAGKGDYLERTSKVGSYEKNTFGLHDMHGNVAEWCADRYGADYYGKSAAKDPAGPSEGSDRVVRGGSWGFNGRSCRSALRGWSGPANRNLYLGFRVALVPSGR